MGRRLYGVDLDESPFGGLIEGLLTEEELEKLADGGRQGGTDEDPGGGSDGEPGGGSDDASAGAGTGAGTGSSSGDGDAEYPADSADTGDTADAGDAGDSSDDSAAGDDPADSFTWGDTAPGQSSDPGEFAHGEPGNGADVDAGGDGFDRYDSYGSGEFDSSGEYGSAGGVDFGTTGFEEPEDDDSGGVLSTVVAHRGLVLKVTVVLALLAVVAALVWKYAGTIKRLVPGRGGDEAAASGDTATGTDSTPGPGPVSSGASDGDVSPARRRAKAGSGAGSARTGDGSASLEDLADAEPADEEPADEEPADAEAAGEPAADADGTADGRSSTSGPPSRGREPSDAVPGPERPGSDEDVDLGALVGLGALALVAAVVRKFGEDRPHDPLVDGPEEE